MIGEIISNSAINAKMHAKMRNLLKTEDYDKMICMRSVSEIAEYLKGMAKFKRIFENSKSGQIHRGQLEAGLRSLMARDIQSFLAFSGTSYKFFLRIFAIKGEVEHIKMLIRLLNSNENKTIFRMTTLDGEYSSGVDFTALANAQSFNEFVEILKPTIYHTPLKGFVGKAINPTNFEIEAALDRFYRHLAYNYTTKHLSKTDASAVAKLFDADTDMENLMFIIRAKLYYKMDKELIKLYLGEEGSRLKSADIKKLLDAETDTELKNAVRETYYGYLFDEGIEKAEHKIAEEKTKLHRQVFKRNPYSIESVLYYIKLQELEIKNITMTVEGVRYGLPPDTIKGYLLCV